MVMVVVVSKQVACSSGNCGQVSHSCETFFVENSFNSTSKVFLILLPLMMQDLDGPDSLVTLRCRCLIMMKLMVMQSVEREK